MTALLELKTAQFELQSTRLIAPFNGKVANIESRVYENVNAGKSFTHIGLENTGTIARVVVHPKNAHAL